VSRRITLGVRLTPETLDALRLVARCQHITLSEAARRVLTDFGHAILTTARVDESRPVFSVTDDAGRGAGE
jgi:hypothetical protein